MLGILTNDLDVAVSLLPRIAACCVFADFRHSFVCLLMLDGDTITLGRSGPTSFYTRNDCLMSHKNKHNNSPDQTEAHRHISAE